MSTETRAGEDVIVAFRSPARRKGFAQIPTVVILDKTLSDAAKVLYALLVSYAMQTGSFKVSQASIGEDMGKGERTVRTLLGELSRRGLITVHRQGVMLPNIYFVEDAYALYDSQQPQPKKQVRTQKGPKENGRSLPAGSDRKKMAGHGGRNQPVIAAKNSRLLKNQSPKNQEKESPAAPGFVASLFEERKAEERPLPDGENGFEKFKRNQAALRDQARRKLGGKP